MFLVHEFEALAGIESCNSSSELWKIFASHFPRVNLANAAQNAINISTIHEVSSILLESLTFFNSSCLESSSSNIEKIKSLRTTGDRKVESANVISKEWHYLRHTRHELLLETLVSGVSLFKKEHNRISRCWKILIDDIGGVETIVPPGIYSVGTEPIIV